MKHHNLYRLALLGYWLGGAFLIFAFLSLFIAIVFDGSPWPGLALLFGITGVALVGSAAGFHAYALDHHSELKPLPRDVRRKVELEARTRRADLELERTIEDAEERTRIIQGKAIEQKKHGTEDWYH